jgi:hypothetical protein
LSWAPRSAAYVRAQDLDHIGHGLSPWQTDAEVRHRTATGAATIFVPADAGAVEIPLYIESPAATAMTVSVDSTLANRVVLPGSQWTTYRLVLHRRYDRRFVPIGLQVDGQPGVRFRVGKVSAVRPTR